MNSLFIFIYAIEKKNSLWRIKRDVQVSRSDGKYEKGGL